MTANFLAEVRQGKRIVEEAGCYRLQAVRQEDMFPSGQLFEPGLYLPAFHELVCVRVTDGKNHRDFFVMIAPDWNPDDAPKEDEK